MLRGHFKDTDAGLWTKTHLCLHPCTATYIAHIASGQCPSSADLPASQAISTSQVHKGFNRQAFSVNLGVSLSHPKVAQVSQQLIICTRGQDTSLFKWQQQALNGSQVLRHCSSYALQCTSTMSCGALQQNSPAVLCNKTLNTPLGMLSAMLTSFSAIQALLGSGTFKVSWQDANYLRLIGLQLNRIIRSTEQILRYKD